jgi:hypothetical protein
MGAVVFAVIIGTVCFGLGYAFRSHIGTVFLGACLVMTWLAYRARPAGGSLDETSVLWRVLLATAALSFGLYLLGVLYGRRTYHP